VTRARYVIETRARGAKAWCRWLDASTGKQTVHASRAAATRHIRNARVVMPDLEYRAQLVGGPSLPEADRTARVVSMRLAPATMASLDALAKSRRLSRGACVAALVREAK